MSARFRSPHAIHQRSVWQRKPARDSLSLNVFGGTLESRLASCFQVPPRIACTGSVIYAYQSHIELAGCTVRDTRGGRTGAVNLYTSTGNFTNCTFTRLEAEWAVALYAYTGSSMSVDSCLFHDNYARVAAIVDACAFFLSSLRNTKISHTDSLCFFRSQTWTRA